MVGRTRWQPQRYFKVMVLALVCVVLLAQAVSFNTATTIFKQNGTIGYSAVQKGGVGIDLDQQAAVVVAGHGLQDNGTYDFNDAPAVSEQAIASEHGNSETSSTLTKRIPPLPFIDNTYRQAKKKGQNLLCTLKDPSRLRDSAKSPWTSIEQLAEWGWVRDVDERDDEKDYSHVVKMCPGLEQMLGTDLTGGKQRKWDHKVRVEREGVVYYATGGTYNNVYWPKQGIIMANDNWSPAYQAEQGKGEKVPFKDDSGKPLPLPPMKQWSTVNALTYTSLPSPLTLRFIIRRNIRNPTTVSLISTVLKKNDLDDKGQAPVWPGVVLNEGMGGFEALVGSPNLAGVVWWLLEMGGQDGGGAREIKGVRVWRDKGGAYAPTIMVEVG